MTREIDDNDVRSCNVQCNELRVQPMLMTGDGCMMRVRDGAMRSL